LCTRPALASYTFTLERLAQQFRSKRSSVQTDELVATLQKALNVSVTDV